MRHGWLKLYQEESQDALTQVYQSKGHYCKPTQADHAANHYGKIRKNHC